MDYSHLFFPALASLLGMVAIAANLSQEPLSYPETRKDDVTDDYFGTVVADPYRWLEDANAEETAQWVAQQNEVTYAYLNQLPERAALLQRLTELYDYPRYSLPSQEGGRTFFFRNDGLQNQSVLYVQDTPEAEPRLLLDPNALSADGTVALNGFSVSEDGKLLVYSLSQGGSDWQEVHLKDVETGQDRDDQLEWVKFSGFSWTHDNVGFFYSRFPAPAAGAALQQANRDKKLYYHRIGTPQTDDVLIYERPDQPDWGIYSEISDDGRYLLLTLTEGTDRRNRLYYKDLGSPESPDLAAAVIPLFDAFDASYSYLGHDDRTFYILTDKDAPRSKVVAVDLTHPDPSQWKLLIPEDADVLRSIAMLGDQFIAGYLHNAYSEVRFYDLEGKFLKKLETPTLGSIGGFSCKRTDSECFYAFTSYLYPTTLYRYDAKTGKSTVFRKPEIKFDPSPYETRQVFYKSKDGTKVSMFLTHRKDLKQDGSHPVYLYGYGGFGASLTPGFDASSVVWLERGGVVAIANLRGGGEYGEEWHQAGTKLNKQNVFDDFIAAAEYLIAEKITRPGKIGIAGGSNGGTAGRRDAQSAPGPVRRGPACGGRHGHAALPPLHHRLGLEIRLWQQRRPGTVPGALRLLAPAQPQSRNQIPGRPRHHRRPRRPRRPCALLQVRRHPAGRPGRSRSDPHPHPDQSRARRRQTDDQDPRRAGRPVGLPPPQPGRQTKKLSPSPAKTRSASFAGLFHRDGLALSPGVVSGGIVADPAFVHRIVGALVAGVGGETEAIAGVGDRAVHGVHSEEQHIAALKLGGLPLPAELLHHLDRVVRECAGHMVAVHIHLAIGGADALVACPTVRADEDRQRPHVIGDVGEGRPAGIEVVGAAPHIDDVVVRARKVAGRDHTQPLVVEGQDIRAQEVREEVHDMRRFDEVEEGLIARQRLAAPQKRAAPSRFHHALLDRKAAIDLIVGVQVRQQHVAHGGHFLHGLQAAQQQIAVLIHPLPLLDRVVQNVVRIAQRAQIGAPEFQFLMCHLQLHVDLP